MRTSETFSSTLTQASDVPSNQAANSTRQVNESNLADGLPAMLTRASNSNSFDEFDELFSSKSNRLESTEFAAEVSRNKNKLLNV